MLNDPIPSHSSLKIYKGDPFPSSWTGIENPPHPNSLGELAVFCWNGKGGYSTPLTTEVGKGYRKSGMLTNW